MSFEEKEARTGRRSSWEGQAAPSATQRPLITIKHFNDLLSDESLDFIVIHHVSLRKEKKACLTYTSQPPLGIALMEIKDGEGSKGPGSHPQILTAAPGNGPNHFVHRCVLGRGSQPPTLPHTVKSHWYGNCALSCRTAARGSATGRAPPCMSRQCLGLPASPYHGARSPGQSGVPCRSGRSRVASLSCRTRWPNRPHGATLARPTRHASSSFLSCLALLS